MVAKLAGKNAQLDQAQVQAMRDMLGTPTGSLLSQYFDYLGQLLHGNFGVSYTYYPFKVTEVIGQAFWWTFILVSVVQVLSFLIGTLLGAFAAWRRNSRFDTNVTLIVDLPRQPATVLDRAAVDLGLRLHPRLVPHRRGI